MKDAFAVLLKPCLTEKATKSSKNNIYTFYVHVNANKHEIAKAVEEVYKVKVAKVRTLLLKGKYKRYRFPSGKRPDRKKAYVKLKEGRIDIF